MLLNFLQLQIIFWQNWYIPMFTTAISQHCGCWWPGPDSETSKHYLFISSTVSTTTIQSENSGTWLIFCEQLAVIQWSYSHTHYLYMVCPIPCCTMKKALSMYLTHHNPLILICMMILSCLPLSPNELKASGNFSSINVNQPFNSLRPSDA